MSKFWYAILPVIGTLAVAGAGAALSLDRAIVTLEERKPDRSEVAKMIDDRLDGITDRLENAVSRLEFQQTRIWRHPPKENDQ